MLGLTYTHLAILVLEKVREVLKPSMLAGADDRTAASTDDYLSNRFASLAVYEPSQQFLDAPDIERPSKPPGDDDTIYEAESMSSFEDAIFALTALINDMNRIRAHIRWIWSNYKIGIFDLAAAAITTNTAIDLVRNMMVDVLPLLQKNGGVGPMLQKFYIFQCLQKGWVLMDILVTGRKDNFNYATYDIANDIYFIAYQLLEAFANVLQPGHLPLYKEGMYGYYDPASDRSRKTGEQKFEDDCALLMPLFAELITVVRTVLDWPVKDEFLRGMEELDRTKEIPFYVVFATQIFLDITYELGGDIQKPFLTMVGHTTIMDNDISSHFEFHANLKISNWPASNDRWMRDVQQGIKWIREDPPRRVQELSYRRLGTVPPDTESHRILRMSPVISGLLLYHFRQRYREAGLVVANAWGSIQYCGHLYNALRREKLLNGMWRDMDIVYTSLGVGSFYVGSDEPKTPEDYFKKFCLQMGTSAAAMSRGRRINTPLASKAGPRGLKEGSPVMSMFKERYVDGSGQVDLTPEHVDQIIEAGLFEQEENEEEGTLVLSQIEDPGKLKEAKKKRHHPEAGRQQPRKKAADGGHISPESLIKPLLFALHAETFEFTFPYLIMHRWCWRVLRSVKDSCDSLLRQLYTRAYMERETELPFVVGWIFMAAAGVIPDRRPLVVAAHVLDEFIECGTGSFIMTLMEREFGMPVEFQVEDE